MRARRQNPARHRFAKPFQHRLLARVNEHDAGGQQQHRQLREQQHRQIFLEQLKKPRLGNIEAKLIIQRLRRRREQAFRLAEQSDEPAVVNRAGNFSFDARPVNFQQQRDQHFHRHQAEQHASNPCAT